MKIIGNTVGTTLPKPNLDQTDPSKGDYIKGDRSFTKGDAGATFTPNVDAEGNLSWSNDGGLENPETVNLKGKDGYTPVKGTDYYTEEDKEEMVEKVLDSIPGVTSVHTVQEGNVYTMTITLNDGSTSVNEITVENGLPTKIVVDGAEIPMTWEIEEEAAEEDSGTENATYFYNSGDLCESYTNGYASPAEYDTVVYEDTYINIYGQTTECQLSLRTNMQIDMTNYSMLYFTVLKHDGLVADAAVGVTSVASFTSKDDFEASVAVEGSMESKTYCVDVSALNGSYYVAVVGRSTAASADTGYHIGAIYAV